MIEGLVAESISLAHRRVDVVGADENGNKIRPVGDDTIQPFKAVPRQVPVNTVIDELEVRQRRPRHQQLQIIEADRARRQACPETDDGFHAQSP